jgi:regulator of ribonuclease activity B
MDNTLNNELQQWREHTEALVADLIADGSNEEVFHTIEHHFASEDFELLEQAAITAFKLGFEVEEPEEAELEDGSKIFAFDISTEQALDVEVIFKETQEMFALAQKCRVDYDGWGTYFEE